MNENKTRLILASKSPRRIELLSNLGINSEIIPADIDERLPENIAPNCAVEELAMKKADFVYSNELLRRIGNFPTNENFAVVAADTMVFKNNILLGKPKNRGEAYEMLSMLSDDFHSVFTGFAVIYKGKCICRSVETRVHFKKLSDECIKEYIASGEPFDKAGGYGIQGLGALFADRIEGDYFNVVGLPLSELFFAINQEFGLTVADFARSR